MSTDLHDRAPRPSDKGADRPEKPKPALSIAQVVGGALAAMTAAALGSRLSVAGTVVGAALASVVAAVAGSLYTSSLRRTSQHVTKVISSRSRSIATGASGDATGTGSPTRPDSPTTAHPVDGATAETRTEWGWAGAPPASRAAVDPGSTPEPGASPATGRTDATTDVPHRRWKPVVLGALLMFVIAAVVLTGFELATGRSLSGGSGTTVGQVAEGRSGPTPSRSATPATPSTTPSATADPSATASTEPTPSGSATASSGPTATPSASESAAPSASPTPSASAVPSSSATPGAVPTA